MPKEKSCCFANSVVSPDSMSGDLPDHLEAIGVQIRQRREAQSLTQEQLAEKMNLSRASINKIETGKANFKIATLISACKALGLTPNDILCDFFPEAIFHPHKTDKEMGALLQKYSGLRRAEQKKCLQVFELVLAQCSGDEVSINVVEKRDVFRYRE